MWNKIKNQIILEKCLNAEKEDSWVHELAVDTGVDQWEDIYSEIRQKFPNIDFDIGELLNCLLNCLNENYKNVYDEMFIRGLGTIIADVVVNFCNRYNFLVESAKKRHLEEED